MSAPLYPPSPVRYFAVRVDLPLPIHAWNGYRDMAMESKLIEKAYNDAMEANLGTTRICNNYVYKITGFRDFNSDWLFAGSLVAIGELQGPVENKP